MKFKEHWDFILLVLLIVGSVIFAYYYPLESPKGFGPCKSLGMEFKQVDLITRKYVCIDNDGQSYKFDKE